MEVLLTGSGVETAIETVEGRKTFKGKGALRMKDGKVDVTNFKPKKSKKGKPKGDK